MKTKKEVRAMKKWICLLFLVFTKECLSQGLSVGYIQLPIKTFSSRYYGDVYIPDRKENPALLINFRSFDRKVGIDLLYFYLQARGEKALVTYLIDVNQVTPIFWGKNYYYFKGHFPLMSVSVGGGTRYLKFFGFGMGGVGVTRETRDRYYLLTDRPPETRKNIYYLPAYGGGIGTRVKLKTFCTQIRVYYIYPWRGINISPFIGFSF